MYFFLIYIYIYIITDNVTKELSLLVYSRELKNNYCKCHSHCLITDRIAYDLSVGYMLDSQMKIPTMKKKPSMESYTVFLLVICYIHQ